MLNTYKYLLRLEFPLREISRLWSSEVRDCAFRCISTNDTEKCTASFIGPTSPKIDASSHLVDLVLTRTHQTREFKALQFSDKEYMYSLL